MLLRNQNQGCQMDLRLSQSDNSADAAKVPISALNLFDTLSILAIVPLFEKFLYPWMKRKYGESPKLLARCYAGFILCVAAMVVAGFVEIARKSNLPNYNFSAGKGYFSDPVAVANASPCVNLDEYNPAAYEAWWQYNYPINKKYYQNKLIDGSYVEINGYKIFDNGAAPAYCRQTCDKMWFSNNNVENNKAKDEVMHLNLDCIACDPIPQISTVSVLWQIPQFCLIGAAEVLASVSSLEFFYSQAPTQFRSVVQSFNLFTTAMGSIIVIPLILIVNSSSGDVAYSQPGKYSIMGSHGGPWVPGDLNYGNLDGFFFLLAILMVGNIFVLKWISTGYVYHDDKTLKESEHND